MEGMRQLAGGIKEGVAQNAREGGPLAGVVEGVGRSSRGRREASKAPIGILFRCGVTVEGDGGGTGTA